MTTTRPLLPVAAGNWRRGRAGGRRPDVIVIHIMEGTMAGTRSWFANPAAEVSAHYGISRGGEVVQWVRDEDTAYHAGVVRNPTAELVRFRPGVNPNAYTLGIEHEGFADQEPPRAMLEASAELIVELSTRWGIPIDARHVIPHRAVRDDKECPGRINVADLIARARLLQRERTPEPTTPMKHLGDPWTPASALEGLRTEPIPVPDRVPSMVAAHSPVTRWWHVRDWALEEAERIGEVAAARRGPGTERLLEVALQQLYHVAAGVVPEWLLMWIWPGVQAAAMRRLG